MRRFFSACLIILAISSTANACINDSELPQREREFRSQYMSRAVTQTEPNEAGFSEHWNTVNKTIGIGLVSVAVCAGLMRDAV